MIDFNSALVLALSLLLEYETHNSNICRGAMYQDTDIDKIFNELLRHYDFSIDLFIDQCKANERDKNK